MERFGILGEILDATDKAENDKEHLGNVVKDGQDGKIVAPSMNTPPFFRWAAE